MKSKFVFQRFNLGKAGSYISCGTLSTLLTQIDTGRGIVRFVFSPAGILLKLVFFLSTFFFSITLPRLVYPVMF